MKKKIFDSFLNDFRLIETKIKRKMKKFKKMISIFELSTLKLGHSTSFYKNLRKKLTQLGFRRIFIKIREKKKSLVFDGCLNNWNKNEDEDQKFFLKTSTIFGLITLKLAYVTIFMKTWEKNFEVILTNQGKNKDEDEKSKNQYEFWTLHPKIRTFSNFHKNLREKVEKWKNVRVEKVNKTFIW